MDTEKTVNGTGESSPAPDGSAREIDGSVRVRCKRCGYEGFPDAATILGFGPIWGCPECDAVVAMLKPIEPNAPGEQPETRSEDA